jgi:hypothetical protein
VRVLFREPDFFAFFANISLVTAQRGRAATKKNNRSRNGTLTEFFICFISVRVHFREPKIFAFSAKISL